VWFRKIDQARAIIWANGQGAVRRNPLTVRINTRDKYS
jgi:hypothetical protein